MNRKQEGSAGYVYIFGGEGLYKIGYSKDPHRRIRQFALPFEAELLHVIETDTPQMLEYELHQRLNHRRTHGEWFRLTQEDFEALRKEYRLQQPERTKIARGNKQGPSEPWKPPLYICRVKSYLSRLKSLEQYLLEHQPNYQPRDVPTLEELRRAAKISPWQWKKFRCGRASEHQAIARVVLDELNRRGFDADLGDIITYRRPAQEE